MAKSPSTQAKKKLRSSQTNFSFGELDPEVRFRHDLKAFFGGARSLRNSSLLVQGGVKPRDGTVYRADLGAKTLLHEYSFTEGQDYILAFQNTKCLVFNDSGSLLATLTGCPWNETQMYEMTIAVSGDTTLVCHQDFATYKILRTGASTFTGSNYAFEVHSDGQPTYQPYYKYAAASVTLNPSATSGSITLTASADHFVSDDVNSIYRYKGKEVRITAITSATVANATVLETLPASSADADWDEQTFSTRRGYPRAVCFHSQRLCFGGSKSRPDGFWASKTSAFFNFDVGEALDNEAIDATVAADSIAEIRHLVSSRNIQIFANGGELFIPIDTNKPMTPGNVQFVPQTPFGCSQKVNPIKFDGATLFLQKSGSVIREFLFSDIEQAHTSNAVSPLSNHLIKTCVDSAVLLGTDTRPEQYAFFVNSDGSVAVFHSARNDELAGWVPWDMGTDKIHSLSQCGTKLFASTERTVNVSTVYWLEEFDPAVDVDAAVKFDTTTELVANTDFSTSASWTLGTGWSILDGVASSDGSQTSASDLTQTISISNGKKYSVRFTLSGVTAGNLTPKVGGASGTAESQNGTWIQEIVSSTGSTIEFEASSTFVGSIDDVSVVEINDTFTLAHLPNTTLHGVADTGASYMGEKTANGSGVVTFDRPVKSAVVGKSFTWNIESNPPDAISGSGTLVGLKKRIGRLAVSVKDARTLKVNNNELIFTGVSDDFSQAPESKTQEYIVFLKGWAIDPTFKLSRSVPLPVTIRGVYMEFMA